MKWKDAMVMLSGIKGLMLQRMYRELFFLAKGVRDGGTIFEIGTYNGKSACAMGFACMGTKKKVYTCDTDDLGVRKTVKRLGLRDIVHFIPGDSAQITCPFREIDLLFIDGNHRYEKVIVDYGIFVPKLRHDGVLVMDDIYGPDHFKHKKCPGPWQVWEENAAKDFMERRLYGRIGIARGPK